MRLTIVRPPATMEHRSGLVLGHLHGTPDTRPLRALAAQLATESFAAIYASDLGRARRTAEAIARHHDAPLIITHALRDRDWGEYTGRRTKGEPRFGETKAALRRRAHAFLTRLGRHERDHVLLVTHNTFARELIRHLTGLLPPPLAHASITTLDVEGARDSIVCFSRPINI